MGLYDVLKKIGFQFFDMRRILEILRMSGNAPLLIVIVKYGARISGTSLMILEEMTS